MPTEPTHPPTPDPLALVLARLGDAFTAVLALADAVDALPAGMATEVRSSVADAIAGLVGAEAKLSARDELHPCGGVVTGEEPDDEPEEPT